MYHGAALLHLRYLYGDEVKKTPFNNPNDSNNYAMTKRFHMLSNVSIKFSY